MPTLYFKGDEFNSNWEEPSFWFLDDEGTIPATGAPWLDASPLYLNYDLAVSSLAPYFDRIGMSSSIGAGATGTCNIPFSNYVTINGGVFTANQSLNYENGSINGGIFSGASFHNYGDINDGIFNGTDFFNGYLDNRYGVIYGGTFSGDNFYIPTGDIYGGTFSGNSGIIQTIINGGVFTGANLEISSSIFDGSFSGSFLHSYNYGMVFGGTFSGPNLYWEEFNGGPSCSIRGGTFLNQEGFYAYYVTDGDFTAFTEILTSGGQYSLQVFAAQFRAGNMKGTPQAFAFEDYETGLPYAETYAPYFQYNPNSLDVLGTGLN